MKHFLVRLEVTTSYDGVVEGLDKKDALERAKRHIEAEGDYFSFVQVDEDEELNFTEATEVEYLQYDVDITKDK